MRFTGTTVLWVLAVVCVGLSCQPAVGASRSVDLVYDYLAASTLDYSYNPALTPDMDGDGHSDFSQPSVLKLVEVLLDEGHPQHALTSAAFVANEGIAFDALNSVYPGASIVAPLSELWAVYMTIDGEGSYSGPSRTGMAGRVETIWQMLSLSDIAGPFAGQPWVQAPLFEAGAPGTAIAITPHSLVTEGDTVVFSATPSEEAGYMWTKDGVDLGWPDSHEVTLDPVTLGDAGDYRCEIALSGGGSASTPVMSLDVVALAMTPGPTDSVLWAIAVVVVLTGLVGVYAGRRGTSS